jgi:hypothetical protein
MVPWQRRWHLAAAAGDALHAITSSRGEVGGMGCCQRSPNGDAEDSFTATLHQQTTKIPAEPRRRRAVSFYWERHPDGPFVTLIEIATTYLDPENYDLDELKALAKRDDLDEVRVFKAELREALRDPARLPGDELFESVEYGNGSDEAFLVWLWHELYGDEASGASVLTRLKALPEPFAGRLDSQASHNIYKAACVGEWDKALGMLLAGLAESNAVSPAEREELATLLSAIGQPDAAFEGPGGGVGGSPGLRENRSISASGADA